MKIIILTICFVFISVLCVSILFFDIFKIIQISNTKFALISILGIFNAFVYSELIFGKKKKDDFIEK